VDVTTQSQPETLVTGEMLKQKGVWGPERVSPPVSESDIRKWAIAVYWPEKPPRIYWDAEYARTTRWGGIIAAPDFNPFAWPVEREIRPERASARAAGPGSRGMNGGQVDTYGVPMRPGDVITARSRLMDWDERQTRLGLTLFSRNETEWRNQRGELVKRRVSTGIRY
jgi:acyl dehydratase